MGHYKRAPVPDTEPARLEALRRTGLLDTPAEQAFDDAVRLASEICGAPVSLVSLIDQDRQWFKARVGLDARETPRDRAFCSHTILQQDVFVVPDALADPEFRNNPLVAEAPNIRFYAGAPLITPDGQALGALCVIDHVPRDLTSGQRASLKALARQVSSLIELRRGLENHRQAVATIADRVGTRARELEAGLAELELYRRLVSHDLYEPLRGMMGFLQLLARRSRAQFDETSREYLAAAITSVEQLQALLHGLATYSRLGAGSLYVGDVDSGAVFEGALNHVCPRVVAIEGKVRSDPLPLVRVNALQLALLFDNLLDNAVKFRSPDTPLRVHVRANRDGPQWRFSVEDNGIGVEPGYRESIFQGARRLHTKDRIAGAGMGLAVCRRIVERHGGKIWMESDGPGRGSTLFFTLPAIPDDRPAAPRPAPE